MIWDRDAECDARDSDMDSMLADELNASCGKEPAESGSKIEHVAGAVARFLRERRADSSAAPQSLVLLFSQALASVGEKRMSRRVFLFGTGVVRPSEWIVAGHDAVWVLDLRRMVLRRDDSIELLFFNCLTVVLDSIADVWDESEGEGVLGLRHVCDVAAILSGRTGKGKARVLMSEIRTACEMKLRQLAGSRKWTSVPRLMNMDGE